MSEILKQAIEKLNAAPPALQEELARVVMDYPLDDDTGIYRLTPEEAADLDEADREIERGEIATPAEVEAMFAKHRA